MRFQPDMKGVTPLLSSVPPESTMNRPDGPHSGNPAVRKEVAERLPQHVAWLTNDLKAGDHSALLVVTTIGTGAAKKFLKLVSNAICWTAKVEIPDGGLPVNAPAFDALKNGQDEKDSR